MLNKSLVVVGILAYQPSATLPLTSFQWEQYRPALISDRGAGVQKERRSIMNSSRSGSGPKESGQGSHGQSMPGTAGPGETVDPTRIPDERRPGEGVHEAPAPGIPMSEEQYDWLKRKAKVVRTPSSKHKQEDPSAKRRK
jgi:hypothetical protein